MATLAFAEAFSKLPESIQLRLNRAGLSASKPETWRSISKKGDDLSAFVGQACGNDSGVDVQDIALILGMIITASRPVAEAVTQQRLERDEVTRAGAFAAAADEVAARAKKRG